MDKKSGNKGKGFKSNGYSDKGYKGKSGGNKSFSDKKYGSKDKKFDDKAKGKPRVDENEDAVDTLDELKLEGRNAVHEAIKHDKGIDKIFIKKGIIEGTLRIIIAQAREKGIIVQEVDKEKLDEMSDTRNHQGIIAFCPAIPYVEVSEILQIAKDRGESPFILVLDGIKDPHNLGAIIRTAECCGVHGIIIPKRRAVGLSAIVSKTSAGAIAHMAIARVTNIGREIDELKKAGVWFFCGDAEGDAMYHGNLKGAVGIVIGSEGEGVSKLIREKCDVTLKIPMYGNISSLNASVAASILMYEVIRQNKFVN